MQNNKTRKPWRFFFLFSLERLDFNNRGKVLHKNTTFKLTFLFKQCLLVKNDLQLLGKVFIQTPGVIVFWSKDKKSKVWNGHEKRASDKSQRKTEITWKAGARKKWVLQNYTKGDLGTQNAVHRYWPQDSILGNILKWGWQQVLD